MMKLFKMKRIFAVALAMLPLAANSATPDKCYGVLWEGFYLRHLHCLGTKDDSISLQLRATALSFLGQEAQAQSLMTQSEGAVNVSGRGAAVGAVRRLDAVEELGREASKHNVVMLNEAHHEPRHRVFALELASALRTSGFTHLALEGLNPNNSAVKNGYVTLKNPITGIYTAEPQFSNFIRQAVAMGFTLIPYESIAGSTIEEREQGQARNLSDFVKGQPGAKVLVYAGYSHISERDGARAKGYMAKYFKLYSGVDPLTIDQVGGTAQSPLERSDPNWRAVSAHVGHSPAVFKKKDGGWLVSDQYEGRVDVTVFHPATVLKDGRPDWLQKNRIRHDVKKPEGQGAMVIRAVIPDEINGVPADQILIHDSQSPAVLFLPKGNYRIESETLKDGVVGQYDIAI